MSELVAMATATTGSPCHHALKCRMSTAATLATVIAIAVAAKLDGAERRRKNLTS